MAQPNNTPSLHSGLFAGFGLFVPSADVQVFRPQVSSYFQAAGVAGVDGVYQWAKPPGCKFVKVICIGPGGGGGSARKGTTITVCCGGGGGAAGGIAIAEMFADDIPGDMFVYVPAGRPGGAAISANDTSGNPGAAIGTNHSVTTFGFAYSTVQNYYQSALVAAPSGGVGLGGTALAGSGGSAPTTLFAGGIGSSASTTGNNGVATAVAFGNILLGGASGAGLTSGNVHSDGGTGGGNALNNAGPVAAAAGLGGTGGKGGDGRPSGGSATNTNQLLAFSSPFVGLVGAAGGGSASSADAVSGGSGGNGWYGCGGGGGGAATDTTSPNSGAGGNGGDGLVIVIAW